MQLTKEQPRNRWNELRKLWCEWDPIGVTCDLDWPQDEYDNYLAPTLRMLERGANNEELVDYLTHIVEEYMALGSAGVERSDPESFAAKLTSWFDADWRNTHV